MPYRVFASVDSQLERETIGLFASTDENFSVLLGIFAFFQLSAYKNSGQPFWGCPQKDILFSSLDKWELVGARPLHLAAARPFGHLKAPLGLSLFRFAPQTRSCQLLFASA